MTHAFIRSASIDWSDVATDSYLRAIPALAQLGELDLDRPLTFFAGENGSGKSTLLEAVAVAYGFNPEGGTLNYRFQTYNDVSDLSQAVRLQKGMSRPLAGYFFRAESFFNVATQAEVYRQSGFGAEPKEIYYARYGGRSFHEQSHGESFFSLISNLSGHGLYLLDEPEAALSPQRQLALLSSVVELLLADQQPERPRPLPARRARGRAFAPTPARAAELRGRGNPAGRAVHRSEPLAHPARHPRRMHLLLRRRGGAPGSLRGNLELPGDRTLHQQPRGPAAQPAGLPVGRPPRPRKAPHGNPPTPRNRIPRVSPL